MKHDNLVQHYMIMLYGIIINSLCVIQSNDKGFFMVSYMYFYSGTVQDTTAYCWAILQDCIKNSPTPKASGEFGLSIFPEMSMPSFFWNLKLQILFTPNISLSKLLQYCDTLFLFIATVHVNI